MTFDPVTLEIFRNRLTGIATEMGRVLVRGAFSPNIKERQDSSTAIFDAEGRMVAQAEHIPVHLGAMPDAVSAVMENDPRPGESYLLNDPYAGGTHLPDLTVISVIAPEDDLLGFAAVRAHHADVGGPIPGSFNPRARDSYGEGLRIPPILIARDGHVREDIVSLILRNVRQEHQRRADLLAQLGAASRARERFDELVATHGRSYVLDGFDAVIEYARTRTTQQIAQLTEGTYTASEALELGDDARSTVPIKATLQVDDTALAIDFAGTAEQVSGILNAPPSVTKSSVYFVTRCVTDPDIPPNWGCFDPIDISIPVGSILHPTPPAPVVGGNVETSQRVADVVFETFREAGADVPAQSQGTMNNLVIGADGPAEFTYYETIGGGYGARSDCDGIDGIHVGMTNTKNTPIEALEQEYPLFVERYALRQASGGDGTFRGGLGIERAIRVETDATVSVVSQRRDTQPKGVEGGEPGTVGVNLLDGEDLGPIATREVPAETVVRILTPGGGGYGDPDERSAQSRREDRLNDKI